MAEKPKLQLHGHDESDEESDMTDITLHEGQPRSSTEKLSDKKKRVKKDIEIASAGVSLSDTMRMLDTFDRDPNAMAEGLYSGSGSYASAFEDEPGKRVPKAGVYAEAGVGRARAEFGVFEAEAKGPSAKAHAGASVTGVKAMLGAEVASISAHAGPFGVKAGLGFDTGVSAGVDGVELKVLGTGFSFGPNTSVSFLGSEASCSVM